MFNKIDENDLMIKGSEGMAAAQNNMEIAFAIIIGISIILGYWLGSRPAPQGGTLSRRELIIIFLFTVFAGTVMALPGGIFIVALMAITGGISFWVGRRSLNRQE